MQYHDINSDVPSPFVTEKSDRALPLPEDTSLTAQDCGCSSNCGNNNFFVLFLILILFMNQNNC